MINFRQQEQLEKFYEHFGSRNFDLQEKVAKTYGDTKTKLYFKSIDFIYQLIIAIGVIAGFGFTGLSFVDNILIFLLAELLLFSSIGIGLRWVHKIYTTELSNLEKEHKEIRQHFDERNNLFENILNASLVNGISDDDVKGILKKDASLRQILKNKNYASDSAGFIGKITNQIFFFLCNWKCNIIIIIHLGRSY